VSELRTSEGEYDVNDNVQEFLRRAADLRAAGLTPEQRRRREAMDGRNEAIQAVGPRPVDVWYGEGAEVVSGNPELPPSALRWSRSDELRPARAYVAVAGDFEIIYDPAGPVEGEPGGWYVWKGGAQLGMRFKLADAKALAEAAAR
jgi:hypothetical protein